MNTRESATIHVILYLALVALLLLAPAAQAHVPLLPEGNENISSAMMISDPSKSWAIYGVLQPDRPQYYGFDIEKGQEIHLSLLKSTDPKEKNVQPEMALLGPGLQPKGELPGYVKSPAAYGAITVKGNRSRQATYEPFGPSSYYQLADLDLAAPESGRYYVAVYSNTSGHYSLAIGYREEFTLVERIITPLMLLSIYQWEGQSPSIILMPMLVAALAGILIIRSRPRRTPFSSTGTLAGFLILGTSATVLTQTAFSLARAPGGSEVEISLALAVIPAILGVVALRLSRGEAGILQRTVMAVVGTVALLAGSGLIIGPLLAIASSVLPSKNNRNSERND